MKKFTTRILFIGLFVTLCFSFNSYAQQQQPITLVGPSVSVTGHLIRTTPKLADIDKNSMYGQPLVKTRDKNGIIGFGEEMEETEERLTEEMNEKIYEQYIKAIKEQKPGTGGIQAPGPINPSVPGTSLGANWNGQTSPGLQPTDNNMAAGPNHVIQIVNNTSGSQFTIWNKTGTVLAGPTILATVTGRQGSGDPIVLYDQLADRWFMAEFGPSACCNELILAVSTTSNPTGSWSIYSYIDASFWPDYPKFSVWHNAYYAYSNDFNSGGTSFLGTSVWAFDRAAMLAGNPTAAMVRQRLSLANMIAMGSVGLEGMVTSSQNGLFVVPTSATQLSVFEVTPTFPGGITVGPLTTMTVNPWSSSGAIAQQTGGTLGSLSPRMMFKVNYRNNGGTESIVTCHTIANGALGQVRWYELRRIAGVWTVFQQGNVPGTDGNSRWMPAISMDGCGNIALMYSVAGTGTPAAHPSIRYTGRNSFDPLNTMTLPEAVIINGATNFGGFRWGDYNTTVQDYSAVGVPNNGSFWSTNQYANQQTRVANYSLTGGCAAAAAISAGTATLTAEGCVANNGVIDPGETVTVNFCVTNVGSAPTANLVGTMQATGGVTPISGPQNYGVVVNGGPAVCGSFTFSNTSGICGGSITVSIQMQDGANNLGTVTWTFFLGVLNTALLPNGGFETGTLPPWVPIASNPAPVVNAASPHTGTFAAFLGNLPGPEPLGDASMYQQFTVPASGGILSFWYKGYTEDGITFDWQDAYITNTSNVILATIMHVCVTNPYTLVNYNLAAFAGQTIRVQFLVHQDAFGDVTNMYVDDVSISQYTCCGSACVLTCPANITVNTSPTACGANVNFAASTFGLCGPVSYSPASGSFFPKGTTTVTATAAAGPNCTFTVTVIDNVPPTIVCPANITANNTPGLCSAVVTYPLPVATDNCPGVTITQIAGLPSGSIFPVGTTVNTFRATDAVGLTSQCSFNVTVVDNQPPALTCPVNITQNTDPGVCIATVATPNPVNSDNCAVTSLTWAITGATIASSPATGINYVGTRAFNLNGTTGQGISTVTYTAGDAAGNTTTCSFTVTVNDASIPVISGQPTNQFVCVGSDGTFTVTASAGAGNPLTYQWQTWTGSSGPWVNIAGATSATLVLPAVGFSQNTTDYRVLLTGRCSVVTSGFATLYVNPLPTVSLLASRPLALLPGQFLTITAVVSPGGGTYQWFKNGVAIAATGSSLVDITVDDAGSYTLRYTDPNGCVRTSSAMVVTGESSCKLWVYPNPNRGWFQVRFFNAVNEKVTVNIFNSAGTKVYSQAVSTGLPYSRIDVDISNEAAGVYVVEVIDATGKRACNAKEKIVKTY